MEQQIANIHISIHFDNSNNYVVTCIEHRHKHIQAIKIVENKRQVSSTTNSYPLHKGS